MSQKIADIKRVSIKFKFSDCRWRGLQTDIQIKKNKSPNLVFIGIPSKFNKDAQRTDKLNFVKILKEKGFPNPQALSVQQIDFIQREVMRILGTPNLSDKWWG